MVVDSPAASADKDCGFLVLFAAPGLASVALPGVRARTRLTGVGDSATDSADAICGFFLGVAAGLALLPAAGALFSAALTCASGSTSGAERSFFAAGFLAAGFFAAGFFTAGSFAAGSFAAGSFTAGFLAAGFLAEGFSASVGFVARERLRGATSTVGAVAASVTGSSAGTSPALSSFQAVIRVVTAANLPLGS